MAAKFVNFSLNHGFFSWLAADRRIWLISGPRSSKLRRTDRPATLKHIEYCGGGESIGRKQRSREPAQGCRGGTIELADYIENQAPGKWWIMRCFTGRRPVWICGCLRIARSRQKANKRKWVAKRDAATAHRPKKAW